MCVLFNLKPQKWAYLVLSWENEKLVFSFSFSFNFTKINEIFPRHKNALKLHSHLCYLSF